MKRFEEIESIGKRTPYTVPEGFHGELRQRILAATATPHTTTPLARRTRHITLWSGGVAIAVAVVVAVVVGLSKPDPVITFDQILSQLSDEQCNALVDSYNNDIFLSTME